MAAQQPKPYPLYNTTYTLHRVSPLHTEQLTSSLLSQHAQAFRNLLAGDTLRDVHIGLDPSDTALARSGPLRSVSWKLLGTVEEYEEQRDGAEQSTMNTSLMEERGIMNGGGRGVWISIVYEKAEYTALLLREIPDDDGLVDRRSAKGLEGFVKYPVLAARMPARLKNALVRYLEDNFDVLISPLSINTQTLISTLDTLMYRIFRGMGEDGARRVIKEVLVTLAFAPSPGAVSKEADETLKMIDITITRTDIYNFVMRGRTISDAGNRPFWTALSNHCKAHIAMDINHHAVRVSKVACGAYVLGKDGKMKVFEPSSGGGEGAEASQELWRDAAEEVVASVIGVAEGGLLGS